MKIANTLKVEGLTRRARDAPLQNSNLQQSKNASIAYTFIEEKNRVQTAREQRLRKKESDMSENKLMVLAEQSGIEKSRAQEVLDTFQPFFQKAAEWEEKSKALVITSVDQKEGMKIAKNARLNLKEIRCDAEKTRVRLKESILAEGRIIDGMANIIKGICQPIEAHLEEQEKFVERQEAARILELKTEREEQLRPYGVDTQYYNLSAMSDEAFGNLLDMSKTAFEAKAREVQRLEEERIAREKKEAEERAERERLEAEERARQAAENAKLKAEAEERERQIAAERAKAEAERKAIEAKARKRLAEEKKAREKLEAEAKAAIEKADAETRKAKEAEEKARRELAEKKAEEERTKKEDADRVEAELKRLESAGDKENLLIYLRALHRMNPPTMESEEAKRLLLIVTISIKKCLEKAGEL